MAQAVQNINTTLQTDIFGNPMGVVPAQLAQAPSPDNDNHLTVDPQDLEGNAAYWADVEGYDHEIFNDDDLTQDKLEKSASFITAAKIIYEMEGNDPSDISNKDLTNWAVGHMRGFNMNLVNMGFNTAQITSATPEQKKAFVYLMDAYDQKNTTVGGFFKSAGWMVIDPTTWVGIGTFGAGFAAKETAKAGGKLAIRAALKQAAKKGVTGEAKKAAATTILKHQAIKTTVATGAKLGALEGAIYAPIDGFMRQRVEYMAGRQSEWWSVQKTATDIAIGLAGGGVFGGALSPAGLFIGRKFNKVRESDLKVDLNVDEKLQSVKNRFNKGKNEADLNVSKKAENKQTPPKVEETTGNLAKKFTIGRGNKTGKQTVAWGLQPKANEGELLPNPTRTWLHDVLGKKNPYIWVATKFPKIEVPADSLSSDLSGSAFVTPLIDAIDDRLVGAQHTGLKANMAKITKSLSDELADIKGRVNSGSKPLTPSQASELSLTALENFQRTNKTALKELETSLAQVSDEMQLERKLSGLTREVGEELDTSGNNAASIKVIQDVKDRAAKLINDYETTTGRTFRSPEMKAERIQDVIKGGSGKFHLKDVQAEAMLNYVNAVQRSVAKINDPNFTKSYLSSLKAASDIGDVGAFQKTISEDLDFLFSESHIALKRTNPVNRAAIQDLTWKRTEAPLIELNQRKVGLRRGYFNPHKREDAIVKPPSLDNTENLIMNIEEMDPADTSKASELAGMVKQGYKWGLEEEIIEAIQRLNDRAGRAGVHNLIEALSNDLISKPDYTTPKNAGKNSYYIAFLDHVSGPASSIRHNPNRWGQRDIYKKYTELTFKPRHARKFVAAGDRLSVPGKIFFKADIIEAAWNKPTAYILGGKHSVTKGEDGQKIHSMNLWKSAPEDASGFAKLKHHSGQAVARPFVIGSRALMAPILPSWHATKFLAKSQFSRDVATLALGAGVIGTGIEESIEYVTGEDLKIAGYDVDLTSRALGGAIIATDYALTPLRVSLEAENWAVKKLTGFDAFSYVDVPQHLTLENNVGHWNTKGIFGDRGDISKSEARKALSAYSVENGTLVPLTSANANYALNTDDMLGQIAQSLADDNADISNLTVLQQHYDDAVAAGPAAVSPAAGSPTSTASPTPTAGPTPSGGNTSTGGGSAQAPNAPSPYAPRRQRASSSTMSAFNGDPVQSFGSGIADVARGAFSHSPTGSHFVDSLTGGVGAIYNSVFKKKYEGKDDLINWLVGGVAALFGTKMLQGLIPGADKVPFLGIIMFGLLLGYGSKLTGNIRKGGALQGNDVFRVGGGTRTDGETEIVLETTPDVALKTDAKGNPDYDWEQIQAIDPDNNGKYAVQMKMDGESFVALEMLNANSLTNLNAIDSQANAAGRYLPDDFLKNRGGRANVDDLDQATKWEGDIEAMGHDIPGGKKVYMRPSADNDNSRLVVMEVAM